MPHHHLTFCERTPASWREAREVAASLKGWAFRGHSDSRWKLATTLERAAQSAACPQRQIPDIESEILSAFQRQASQYLSALPRSDQFFEWLSLLQHHGAPTRLLDLTHSFYIACFFGLERATSEASVYCLNVPLLRKAAVDREKDRHPQIDCDLSSPEYCDHAIAQGVRSPLILVSEPFVMNERLSAQQGLFGVPFEVQQSFEYNLSLTIDPLEKHLPENTTLHDPIDDFESLTAKCALLKVKIARELHADIKRDLATMNINAATLFPGLDGFARSLSSAFEGCC